MPTVRESGEFAVRGGLVDLFPAGSEAPRDAVRRIVTDVTGVELSGDSLTVNDVAASRRFTSVPYSTAKARRC